ncbi:sigma-54 interaction domain-containing protein [Alginatibacterium sediminis]|nr:sigma-54 dependent transcriptional regulator [Alginatibacterium sediminis]
MSSGEMIGESDAFVQLKQQIQRVSPSNATVLLLGQSGSGKELAAAQIHQLSQRRSMPFVTVECSGLAASLFESELFGHRKGAFTGAISNHIGLVESAQGGTLFLDEIGEVPLSEQVKLLRLIETQSFRRVGSTEVRQADFRLIAATNKNLRQMVSDGSFREDLFYRLNVFELHLPTLKQRKNDILSLFFHFSHSIAAERKIRLSLSAQTCLLSYDYPGNIRELRNVVERALIMSDGDYIEPKHLPGVCQNCDIPKQITRINVEPQSTAVFEAQLTPPTDAEKVKQHYIRSAAQHFSGSRAQLAKHLGLGERSLYRYLKMPE